MLIIARFTLLALLLPLLACSHLREEITIAAPEPAHSEAKPTSATLATGTAEARFGLKFAPVEFTPPQVGHAVLPNGITLDHYADPAVPMVTIVLRVGVGSVHDPAGKVGAAEMTATVLRNGGTAAMPGDMLDRELDARGAELTATSDREETWLRLSVLEEDLAWGLKVMADLVANPAFPQAKLDEARGQEIQMLQQRLDVPREIASALFPQLVYGEGNPWGWTTTQATLQALTIEDLRAIHAKFYVSGNFKLGLSGAITWEQAQAESAATLGKLQAQPFVPQELAKVPVTETTRIFLVERPITQNAVYFGHEGVNRFTPDKFPLRVFNSVLAGGFTSRLFKEIRSNRGLAYAVHGRAGEGTDKGVFFNVALTKAPSSAEALNLMLDINRDLTQNPPGTEEVEIARQSDVNSFVFFFDTSEGVVRQKMTLDAQGYPEDYLGTYVSKLSAVTPQEVQQAAARNLHLDRITVLIVGQVDAALRKELEGMGPITTITEEELRGKWL